MTNDLPRHSVSVAAVVINELGEVLVIQRRDSGAWQIPGGVLEAGERVDDAVKREVLEETGVRITPEQVTGIYKNMTLDVIAIVMRATAVGGSERATDEASSVEWWTIEKVEQSMTPAFAVRVLDAVRQPMHIAVRHHDGVALLDS